MRKTIKIFSSTVAAAALLILMLVSHFAASLPDSFWVESTGSFQLSSMPFISAVPSQASEAASLAPFSGKSEKTLMLLGVIPIKTVTENVAEAPILLAGGDPFGIKLEAEGAVVVGINEIDGVSPAAECGIQIGDIIISAAGKDVTTNQSLADIIMDSKGDPTEIVISRGGEEKTLTLTPRLTCGTYKAGIDIRDSSAGIGTITFYDPASGMFAGLGHAVCDYDTGEAFPCGKGSVCGVEITGLRKSAPGDPGELQGVFTNSRSIGSIVKNCESGIYGSISRIPASARSYPLGFRQEVTKGEASMICTLDGGSEPKEYSIVIESIDLANSGVKDMVIRVTDEALLSQAGGIVQGMSGSPIIQNGKLVGAVTHVFVKDTCRGYAILADKMYTSLCECAAEEQIRSAG